MKIARNIVFYSGAVFAFLFGFPLLGAYSSYKLASWLGCEWSARGGSECLVFGLDIGDRLSAYAVPFVGSLLTPIALVSAFWDVLIVWGLLALGLHLAYRESQEKANKANQAGTP